jgi:hypothetical protein
MRGTSPVQNDQIEMPSAFVQVAKSSDGTDEDDDDDGNADDSVGYEAEDKNEKKLTPEPNVEDDDDDDEDDTDGSDSDEAFVQEAKRNASSDEAIVRKNASIVATKAKAASKNVTSSISTNIIVHSRKSSKKSHDDNVDASNHDDAVEGNVMDSQEDGQDVQEDDEDDTDTDGWAFIQKKDVTAPTVQEQTARAQKSAQEAKFHLAEAKKAYELTKSNVKDILKTGKKIETTAGKIKTLYTPPEGKTGPDSGAGTYTMPISIALLIAIAQGKL